MKKVNTANPLLTTDEDRHEVRRSEHGKQLTYNEQLTTPTKQKRKITKKETLLANKDIKRWYDNLARSSPVTAEVRLRRLGKFCEDNKMTPMELVEMGQKDPREVANLLEDTITDRKSARKRPNTSRPP